MIIKHHQAVYGADRLIFRTESTTGLEIEIREAVSFKFDASAERLVRWTKRDNIAMNRR